MYSGRHTKNGKQMGETINDSGCRNTRTREKAKRKQENPSTVASKTSLGMEDGSGSLKSMLHLSKGWVALMSGA